MRKVPSIRDYLVLDRRMRENPVFRATSEQDTSPKLNLAHIMNTCLQLEKSNTLFDGFYWAPTLSWPFGNINNTIELSNSPLGFLNPYRLNAPPKLERLFKTLEPKSLLISLSIFPQNGTFASYFEFSHYTTEAIIHEKKWGHSTRESINLYGIIAFYADYKNETFRSKTTSSQPPTPARQQ